MPKAVLVSETPVSLADVKEEIAHIKKRDKELGFRAAKVDEFLSMFVELEPAKAAELEQKIRKLEVPRLKEEHIKKILDLMPANVELLKSALHGYSVTLNSENLKKIVAVVAEYLPKKK